jgi:hypothetical protein
MYIINQLVCTAVYRSLTHFNKWHNVQDKGWRLVDDELVDTGYSMATNNGTRVTEKLNELWNEDIEWTIEGIRVQLITAVLTDLMKSTERTLHKVTHHTLIITNSH